TCCRTPCPSRTTGAPPARRRTPSRASRAAEGARSAAMRIELADDPTAFHTADWTPAVMEDPNGTFFHTPAYLKLWWEEFGAGRLVIATAVEQGSVAAACVFQVEEGLLTFLGGFDVTDYMGPVARPGLTESFAKELLTAVAAEVEWDRADVRGLPDRAPWSDLLEST